MDRRQRQVAKERNVIIVGQGAWQASAHSRRTAAKKAAGKDVFDWDQTARQTGVWKVHDSLNPKSVNKNGVHAGQNIRESLDSTEHPESLAIGVLFDVTGSMGNIPRVLQSKLPKLYNLLLEKGYVEHPQILYGAIGDAFTDHIPLQVGQFESDNRADEALENILLEGGGGGQGRESYAIGAHFMADHTYTDCFAKRGKKGYLFFIGDERVYHSTPARQITDIVGDGREFDLDARTVFKRLQEKWEVYFLFAADSPTYQASDVMPDRGAEAGWKTLLGENALVLDDSEAVCETIALTIGLREGVMDLDQGLDHLLSIGTGQATVASVGKALATVGATAAAVATVDGDFPVTDDGDDDVERL